MTIERDIREESLDAERAEAQRRWDAVAGVAGIVLRRDYGMSPSAVESVLNAVHPHFLAFWKAVAEPERWLTRRIFSKAKEHLALRGQAGPQHSPAQPPHVLELIHMREALDSLPPRLHEVLRLLYQERQTYEEIAKTLDISVRYAERLVKEALLQLRAWRPRQGE